WDNLFVAGSDEVWKVDCLPTALFGYQHVDSNGLILFYFKRARFCSESPFDPIFHVENVGAGRQRDMKRPFAVRRNPRGFCLSILTQDDERIFLIGFGGSIRWPLLGNLSALSFLQRNDCQMPVHETWRRRLEHAARGQH